MSFWDYFSGFSGGSSSDSDDGSSSDSSSDSGGFSYGGTSVQNSDDGSGSSDSSSSSSSTTSSSDGSSGDSSDSGGYSYGGTSVQNSDDGSDNGSSSSSNSSTSSSSSSSSSSSDGSSDDRSNSGGSSDSNGSSGGGDSSRTDTNPPSSRVPNQESFDSDSPSNETDSILPENAREPAQSTETDVSPSASGGDATGGSTDLDEGSDGGSGPSPSSYGGTSVQNSDDGSDSDSSSPSGSSDDSTDSSDSGGSSYGGNSVQNSDETVESRSDGFSDTDVSPSASGGDATGGSTDLDEDVGREAPNRDEDPRKLDPQQGVEEGGQFEEEARQAEFDVIQKLAQDGYNLTREDIRIEQEETKDSVTLSAGLTSTGQREIDQEIFQRTFQAKQELENKLQESTTAQLTRGDDYVIEENQDGVQAQLTEQGKREEAVTQFVAQLDGVDEGDVVVTGEGEDLRAQLSNSARRQRAKEKAAAANSEIDVSDLRVKREDGKFVPELTEEARKEMTAQGVEEKFGLEAGEDFTLQRTAPANRVPSDTGQGAYQIELTEDGVQRVKARKERAEGDIFSGVVESVEKSPDTAVDAISRGLFGAEPDGEVRVDIPGEGSLVAQGRVDAAEADDGERFGDSDLSIPFTQIEYDEGARAAGAAIQDEVIEPASEVGGDVVEISASGVSLGGSLLGGGYGGAEEEIEAAPARVGDLARRPADEESPTTTAEVFGEGATSGALSIANVPAVAATGIEGAEFAVKAVEETAEGDGGEFAAEAGAAGAVAAAEATEYGLENPVRFSGQLAGGVVASGAIIGGASKIGGPVAGRAAATAIQPGEELAISLARREIIPTSLATKVPGVSEGHIGTEFEASADGVARQELGSGGTGSLYDAEALDDAQGVTGPSARSRVRRAVGESSTAQDINEYLDRFLADTRGQSQLASRELNFESDADLVDDRYRGFESEVRRAALEQREYQDFQDLDRGGIYEGDSREGQTRPVSEETQDRWRQAEESRVLEDDDIEVSQRDLSFLGTGVGGGAGFVGTIARQRSAQQSEVVAGEDWLSGFDQVIGLADRGAVDLDLSQEIQIGLDDALRNDVRTEVGVDTAQEIRQETRQETRQELRSEMRQDLNLEIREEIEPGTELRIPNEPRLELFGDEQDETENDPSDILFGSASRVFDTGVVQSLDELDDQNSNPWAGLDDLF